MLTSEHGIVFSLLNMNRSAA